jgi:hypothetical protein
VKFLNRIREHMKLCKLDLIFVACLVILASSVGYLYINLIKGTPSFYQELSAPAVTSACGHGYINVDLSKHEKLKQFLTLQSNSFNCSDLTERYHEIPLYNYQTGSKYLLYAMAITWKITGVSWSGLLLLYLTLFNLTVISSYMLFRLWMNPYFAFLIAIAILTSQLHLSNFVNLRDYAKAPFVILLTTIIGYLVFRNYSIRKYMIYSSVAGLLIGIGLGFRMDLLIFLPLFIVILLFFTSYSLQRRYIRQVMYSFVLFIGTFIISSFPILLAISSGGNTFHVILLGLTNPFLTNLGISPSPLYEYGYIYNDSYLYATIHSYNEFIQSGLKMAIDSSAYDQVAFQYYVELIRQFPADLVTRSVAAIIQVLLLFNNYWYQPPSFLSSTIVGQMMNGLSVGMGVLKPLSILLMIGTVIIYTLRHLRQGAALILLICYLCAYPSLQFSPRHFFHLEFIGLFFHGFFLYMIMKLFSIKNRFKTLKNGFTSWANEPQVRKNFKIIIGTTISLVILFYGLRGLQQVEVGDLLAQYENTAKNKLITTIKNNEDTVLISANDLLAWPSQQELRSDYLMLHFAKPDGENSELRIPFKFVYTSSHPYYNFTRDMVADMSQTTSRNIYQPVFSSSYFQFQGIELNQEHAQYLEGIYRLEDDYELRYLLSFNLPAEWERERRYQTINFQTLLPLTKEQQFINP